LPFVSIIAKNFKQRYPSLLDPTKAKIEIGVTPKIRTEQTADAFLQGIKETVIKQKSGAEDSGIESDDSSSDESEGIDCFIFTVINNRID